MIISAIVFALLLGAFIFLILPRAALARRTLSVGIFVILIAVIYGGSIELLGRPKPLRLEWRGTADAQVLRARCRSRTRPSMSGWSCRAHRSRAPMRCPGASRLRSSSRKP
jgi:hypothetical protein